MWRGMGLGAVGLGGADIVVVVVVAGASNFDRLAGFCQSGTVGHLEPDENCTVGLCRKLFWGGRRLRVRVLAVFQLLIHPASCDWLLEPFLNT